MKKIIYILIALMAVSSCCRKHKASTTVEIHDSVRIVEVVRIDTFKTKADTVVEEHFIDCPEVLFDAKPKTVVKQNGNAKLTSKKDGRKITTTCECLEQKHLIAVKDKTIEHLRNEKKTKTIIQTAYKSYWYDVLIRWLFLILLLFILVFYIIIKIKN